LRDSRIFGIIKASTDRDVHKIERRIDMNQIKVLLCCGAGMSSGFLASNARKIAKKQKLPISVEARSSSEAAEFLSSIDILLLGPHYATELDKFKALAAPYQVPVQLIPQDIYAMLDGERLLKLVTDTLEKGKEN